MRISSIIAAATILVASTGCGEEYSYYDCTCTLTCGDFSQTDELKNVVCGPNTQESVDEATQAASDGFVEGLESTLNGLELECQPLTTCQCSSNGEVC